MKKVPISIVLFFCVIFTHGQTIKTVGGSGADYATLQLAFAAVNNGAIQGQIVLQITGSTTETASAVLNASGSGSASYTSVNIYPTLTGVTIAGNFDASLISLNGADNVTIDGRVNQSGSSPDLKISNINTSSFASAIRFITSAENNVIKYCNLNSSCYSAGVGMVNFTSSNVGNGNDNNTVEYCNITNAGSRPRNAIFSSGTAGRENSGNIIRNNNIYNFFNAGADISFGINLSSNTTNWTITGNSFYDTETLIPTGANKYYGIVNK